MRASRIMDDGGGWDTWVDRLGEDPNAGVDLGTPAPSAPTAPSAPAAPDAPTGGQDPGPVSQPEPPARGNPTPPAPPVPPAVPSAVQGVKESAATGGVQGSFAQAGDAGFSRRFGTPASWFKGAGQKGGASAGILSELANKGRGILGRQGAGSSAGGGTSVPVVQGPSAGAVSGGQNDEQWQRILAEVLKQRFGG